MHRELPPLYKLLYLYCKVMELHCSAIETEGTSDTKDTIMVGTGYMFHH